MAKRWKKEDETYLKRYADKRALAELTERFDADKAEVEEKLEELEVRSKDGYGYRKPYVDPAMGDYEKGLEAFYGGRIAEAKKSFEKVVETSDQADLTLRARSFLNACEARLGDDDDSDLDPYVEAVMAKNEGDHEAALEICKQGGRWAKDGRFAYLAAAIFASSGDGDDAMEHLSKAIELEDTHKVQAYHDSDFDTLREREDFLEIYEQA